MVGIPIEKQCSKCGKMRPFETGFYNDKRVKDGKCPWCIRCKDKNTKENEERRISEPMSPQAEAMRQYYAKRFRVIKAAKLSMYKEGGIPQIDRVLKRHGLEKEVRRP